MARTAREKAIEELGHYIRVRDCLKTTAVVFVGVCITCNRKFHIDNLDAGHFISGRRNAVLFDILGIHIQCTYCNQMMHGCHKKYRKIMVERHGEDWVENREIRAKRVIKDSQIDYDKLLKGLKRMNINLMRKHGFKTFSEILQMGSTG